MKVRLGLFRTGRRFVWVLWRSRQGGTSVQRWLGFHLHPPDWHLLFVRVLGLMGIATQARANRLCLADGAGEVAWRVSRYITQIRLHLEKHSVSKQQLVAAALLKAARYQ